MKHGARNEFVGEIVEIKKGQLMCSVTLKVPTESSVCSVMTLDSLKALGIKKGDKVKAVVKAVNVLLTTD
jgi:molybdopterin-binding protein